MKHMKYLLKFLFAILCGFSINISAQSNTDGVAPFVVTTASEVTLMPSIASRSVLFPSEEKASPIQDGRASKHKIVPGKGSLSDDVLAKSAHKSTRTVQGKSTSLVFETAQSNSQPTDPSGAVGPNHYFAVFNTGFRIFDKLGNALTGQLGVGNIFPASGCCDLTVSYDNLADRWVVSFLGSGVQVAISNGPDPVNDSWTVYNFPSISDYNKLSVWRDGYYLTENTGGATKLWVLERIFDASGNPDPAAQLAGFQLPGLVTSGFHSPQALNITDDNHPTTGGCPIVYLQDDAWPGVIKDHIKVWVATMDWINPSNSLVSNPLEIDTAPFISVFDNGSFANLQQPNGGATIDALQSIIMNQAQFRKFPTHNSAVFNFVVDVDASAAKLAGIRWLELRQATDGGVWTLEQEGTYTAPDNKHAWHGSMAMDVQGNIALGYTAMAGPNTPTDGSVDLTLGSYYTGRFASDADGVMSIAETLIAPGSGNIPGLRYGDYGKMDVDPNNDKEFWFLNEYVGAAGRANVVGVFQIAPNLADDVGVTSIDTPETGTLSAAETISVTIFNYGENPASGFDVTYQLDSGALISETFTGTIASSSSATFTFAAQANMSTVGQTYAITAATAYAIDMDTTNDAVTKSVTHLYPNDVGVSAITSPVSASGLSNAESVTVTITNYGGTTQTSIPVFYTVDGGTPVQETYTGSVASGASENYTFSTTVDLSAFGNYIFIAGTTLVNDADTFNDDVTITVSSFICQPVANCTDFNDGVTQINLADQNISTNCGTTSTGYSDDSNIVFNFLSGGNPFSGVLQVGFQNSNYALWIDFNDNDVFEANEVISSGIVTTANSDFAFTVNFDNFPNATSGMHKMRLRGGDENFGNGVVLNPCDAMTYGRTNDYMANIATSLGLQDANFEASTLTIIEASKNIFDINLVTSYKDLAGLRVYNMLGQELVYYNMKKVGNRFSYNLDMNYVDSGVYIVQVRSLDGNSIKSKKIIVR